MSEAIAETDDELMEKFFGGEPFTTEEIVEGMRKGVKDGLITPYSAQRRQPAGPGYAAVQYEQAAAQPGPRRGHPRRDRGREAVELHCKTDEPAAAYVFKTVGGGRI